MESVFEKVRPPCGARPDRNGDAKIAQGWHRCDGCAQDMKPVIRRGDAIGDCGGVVGQRIEHVGLSGGASGSADWAIASRGGDRAGKVGPYTGHRDGHVVDRRTRRR